ncbi:zinc-ribbon and DUF3426 domain-containing protein [Methylomonas methanica]|uniref:Zinc finger/thioredoxin putative domain-containing protein n=1 Tax=Methylomonas methanica (strain DSM 25384 / MC09) TaxID=857087 RepID=G0A2I4_METMM|nr:DUF3426 domain-containing protein [Methylomonas methanica]AEG00164.1 hypothetical protein Metme_1746 [Methylomonas methanica MC09]
MFSRCPHCDRQQQVTTRQLRDSRGLLTCVSCGKSFDALPALTEMADEPVDTPQREDLLLASGKQPAVKGWRIGNALLFMMLLAQVAYFEKDGLLRQPQLYSGLTHFCRIAGCRMPTYKNSAEWSLSHSAWQAHLDRRYVLTAALTNQAAFAQALPPLKLTLNDYSGRLLAERVFRPGTYTPDTVLAADHTQQIHLPLVVSAPDVAGFTLTAM